MTISQSPEVTLTLEDAVQEVLGLLTGLDLVYQPELDRFRVITRQLNRALRHNALEHEWSWYHSLVSGGETVPDLVEVFLDSTLRPRIVGDDAIRLVDEEGRVVRWAYFLPRDSLHKYLYRKAGLWASVTRNMITFSRPLYQSEAGLDIQIPVMREPIMFRLPIGDESTPSPPVDPSILEQPVDFAYPDVIINRAAWYVAQTDPVMQPRAQTLEAAYKDLMYQVIERDDRNTDAPYLNDFFVPIQNGIAHQYITHGHPHSDERRL